MAMDVLLQHIDGDGVAMCGGAESYVRELLWLVEEKELEMPDGKNARATTWRHVPTNFRATCWQQFFAPATARQVQRHYSRSSTAKPMYADAVRALAAGPNSQLG